VPQRLHWSVAWFLLLWIVSGLIAAAAAIGFLISLISWPSAWSEVEQDKGFVQVMMISTAIVAASLCGGAILAWRKRVREATLYAAKRENSDGKFKGVAHGSHIESTTDRVSEQPEGD
jgi:hypothetical protein